jgi:ribosomal protein S18 acetylase RimI-like enzyme
VGAPDGISIRALAPGDDALVRAASALFDDPPDAVATARFLTSDTHHLLLAVDDASDRAVGFITGVELTHPDKGTELFVYELGVGEAERRRGIGRALVEALAAVGRSRGCRSMWTATEPDNDAALALYARTGARRSTQVGIDWDLSP